VARRLGRLTTDDDEAFAIVCLTVRAEYQGHGVGRALIEHLVALLAASGIPSLEVHATAGGTEPWQAWHAAGFFARLGFEPVDGSRLMILGL